MFGTKIEYREGRMIERVEEFKQEQKPKYIVIVDDSYSKPEEWYGPPDPKPSGSTTYHQPRIIGFSSDEELVHWIKENEARQYGRKSFIVQEYKPLTVQTEVKVNFG